MKKCAEGNGILIAFLAFQILLLVAPKVASAGDVKFYEKIFGNSSLVAKVFSAGSSRMVQLNYNCGSISGSKTTMPSGHGGGTVIPSTRKLKTLGNAHETANYLTIRHSRVCTQEGSQIITSRLRKVAVKKISNGVYMPAIDSLPEDFSAAVTYAGFSRLVRVNVGIVCGAVGEYSEQPISASFLVAVKASGKVDGVYTYPNSSVNAQAHLIYNKGAKSFSGTVGIGGCPTIGGLGTGGTSAQVELKPR